MNNAADHDRIILGNPWIFRNSWLIVKPWDREIDPRTLDFDHAPIWIQLWGLPPHCKTKAMGRQLGALMGDVEESEFYEYPGKQMIIKIKVAINVHKPITSGIHLSNPTDGTCWVDFRYEKLPQVCFQCGLLGHSDKLCRNQALNIETLAPLGPWIRSTQYGRRKMDTKDRKFYSNPSQSPNFGKYSPPVPAALIAQLAAMKMEEAQTHGTSSKMDKGKAYEAQKGNDTQPMDITTIVTQQASLTITPGQPILQLQRQQSIEEIIGGFQKAITHTSTESAKSNQAKRKKLNESASTDTIMAGLEYQASQQP
jgi:hypothetical protein